MAKLKTGRHTSAIKADRQSVTREGRNKSIKSMLQTLVKKIEDTVAKKDEAAAKDLLKLVFSTIDKAAKRNVIHFNKASHNKARLASLVDSIKAKK